MDNSVNDLEFINVQGPPATNHNIDSNYYTYVPNAGTAWFLKSIRI